MKTQVVVRPVDIFYYFLSYGMIVVRGLLSIAIAILIIADLSNYLKIIYILIIGIITLDFLDGVSLRSSEYNKDASLRIKFRKIDATLDRITIQICSIALIIVKPEFIPFYYLILIREVAISSFCVSKYFKKIILYPNLIAKIASASIGLSAIVFLSGNIITALISFLIMLLLSFASFISYRERALSIDDNKNNVIKGDFIEVLY